MQKGAIAPFRVSTGLKRPIERNYKTIHNKMEARRRTGRLRLPKQIRKCSQAATTAGYVKLWYNLSCNGLENTVNSAQ